MRASAALAMFGLLLVGYQFLASPQREDAVLIGVLALLVSAGLGMILGNAMYRGAVALGLLAILLVGFGLFFMSTGGSTLNIAASALGLALAVLAIFLGAVALREDPIRAPKPELTEPRAASPSNGG